MPVKTVAKDKVKKLELGEAVRYMTQSIAEVSRRMDESSQKTEAIIAASIAEMSKKMAESKAETDAKMAESRAETDAKMAESRMNLEAILAESEARRDRAIEEMSAEIKDLSRKVEIVNSGFGTIGERFGKLVELIVIPGIRHEMNAHGHNFKYAKANKKFEAIRRGRKEKITEVDLFLHNGAEVMAAEVKTTLYTGDVDKHLGQLRQLRKYEAETNLKGKKLYGAMVGVFVDYYAREYALENGMYIVEILEQEQKLKTEKPPKCRVW